MTTDFNYNNKTIDSGGPIKPSGKDQPVDPRTRVESYSDIESIPNPYVGMIITVKMDETNQNKMTDYKVLSLKANTLGIANSVIDRVQKYSDYLGASSSGSVDLSGYATKDELNSKANTSDIPTNTSELNNDSGFLTSIPSEYVTETEMNEAIANVSSGGSVSQEDINTAVNNYLTQHPVQSGATAEQAAQIQANTAAIGNEELPTTAKTLKGAIAETFQSVSSGKTLIASAITDKGVTTSNNDTFQTMANNIKSISTSQAQPSSDPYREHRTLIWEDDFNGSSINNENWDYELGYVRNEELQYFTNSSKNAYVDGNSNLVIKAIREDVEGYKNGTPHTFNWTSASLFSNNKQEFLYGRIEAKIKLPNVKGQFPAFWTMGANYEYNYDSNDPETRGSSKSIGWCKCGEIDIMEQFGGGTSIKSTVHYDTGSGLNSSAGCHATDIDMSKFNIYSMEWTSEKLEFFVNDVKTGEFSLSGTGSCFTLPHFILIGMSVSSKTLPIPDESTQSFEMLVDWIRVYAPENYGYDEFTLSKTYYETPTIGRYEQLSPVFNHYFPNTTINWSSSNENVATVVGGKILTTGVGECDIIARLKNNYSAICKCKVLDTSDVRIIPPYFWDYGCTLEANKLTSVKNGKTLTLSHPSILSTESLILNGVNNKITIDKIADSISAFSIHCIFKVTDLSKSNYVISDMSDNNTFALSIRPQENILSVSTGGPSKIEFEYVPDNNFHHFGVSMMADGWTMIYIDGVKVTEIKLERRHTLTGNMYMSYSSYYGDTGYSSGEYKCLYIYDSIPSSDDIKTIYDSLKLSYGINQ